LNPTFSAGIGKKGDGRLSPPACTLVSASTAMPTMHILDPFC
jgi:hypothetical protein